MFAARRDYLETMDILLQNGADPTIRDTYGWSAFGMAATSGHSDSVKLLLKHGVDANVRVKICVRRCQDKFDALDASQTA